MLANSCAATLAVAVLLAGSGASNIGATSVAQRFEGSGIQPLTVIVNMSTFSAVAASLLADREVESRLEAGGAMRVLLFAGRESAQAIIEGTYDKLTTMLRRENSVEVNIPIGNGLYSGSENLPAGWSYAVQLEPGVSTCCDGGDNQCDSRRGSLSLGSVNRSIRQLQPEAVAEHHLVLTLTQLPPPTVREASGNGRPSALINVVRDAAALSGEPPAETGGVSLPALDPAAMVCTLRVGNETAANGQIRLPSDGAVRQTVNGTLDLTYRR